MSAKTRSQKTKQTNSSNSPTTTQEKRKLTPETPDDPETTSQKRKKVKMSQEFEALKHLISESKSAIENKLSESQTSLETKFIDLASKFNAEVASIKSSVGEFQEKLTHEVNVMKQQMHIHTQRLDNTEDDVQRVQLSQDLRLVGFAFKENENLNNLFLKIAAEIGFAIDTNTPMPTLERMHIRNRSTGQFMLSQTIIIHFAVRRQKQLFYSHYLNKMPLDGKKFGLSEECRIVLGENLTKKNAQNFKLAQSLRKNKKIAQTFTEDGLVKIRFNKGKNEATHIVRSTIQLEEIVTQHDNMSQAISGNNATSQADQTHTSNTPMNH